MRHHSGPAPRRATLVVPLALLALLAAPGRSVRAGQEAARDRSAALARTSEDILLLEDFRYLQLAPPQLRQLLFVARQTDPRLKRLKQEEDRALAVLEQVLKKRGADAAAVIQKRLAVARQEIAQWKNFDYLLISGSKQEHLRRTLAIIEAEKMRSARSTAPEI